MAKVVIALGSNLQNRESQLKSAKAFLEELSNSPILSSFVYASEPIGPSENEFLNAVIQVETDLSPQDLLSELKEHERAHGRPSRYPKWTARTIDLDIISYDNLVIETDTLIIPHREYVHRLFVLLPLKDIHPEWVDPVSQKQIDILIKEAPTMNINHTEHNW